MAKQTELLEEYLWRGKGFKLAAAFLFCRDLVAGDKTAHKVGYSRKNALHGAEEFFGLNDTQRAALEVAIDPEANSTIGARAIAQVNEAAATALRFRIMKIAGPLVSSVSFRIFWDQADRGGFFHRAEEIDFYNEDEESLLSCASEDAVEAIGSLILDAPFEVVSCLEQALGDYAVHRADAKPA